MVEKGDQNHNDWAYKIDTTKDRMADNKEQHAHVKVIPITLKQYFRDQFSKDRRMDTLEDILRQFENQT